MSKRTRILAASALLFCVTSQAHAQEATADTVVATINGAEITIGHMIVLRGSLPQQYQELPADVLFKGILEQLVQQSVLAQTVDAPTKGILLRVENERRTMVAGQAMNVLLEGVVTDEAVQTAYDERFADTEPTKEYNASHILVETEEALADIIVELEGGLDFAEAAKFYSTGPSGPNGGELGWFGAGMMVKPFEDAVMGMEIGTISGPIETQFGWHVIKLNESRVVEGPPIDEVRAEISEELRQIALEGELAKLTESADIVLPDVSGIDPAIINQFDLIEN